MTSHKLPLPPDAEAADLAFHYYDQHPTKEDLMGESIAQSRLIHYLLDVLGWLYRAENWLIVANLNLYRERRRSAYPIAPDVAVFLGVPAPPPGGPTVRSWRLYEPGHPPPQVVFEIGSEKTWQDDLDAKPVKYGQLGVHEYYAYDPNEPPCWQPATTRLRGWHYRSQQPDELAADAQGRIWSVALQSWLVPDGPYLRLADASGTLRPTASEAERAAKEAERAAKEAERAAKEAERAAKEAAWAKLRELGIDPEGL